MVLDVQTCRKKKGIANKKETEKPAQTTEGNAASIIKNKATTLDHGNIHSQLAIYGCIFPVFVSEERRLC